MPEHFKCFQGTLYSICVETRRIFFNNHNLKFDAESLFEDSYCYTDALDWPDTKAECCQLVTRNETEQLRLSR